VANIVLLSSKWSKWATDGNATDGFYAFCMAYLCVSREWIPQWAHSFFIASQPRIDACRSELPTE